MLRILRWNILKVFLVGKINSKELYMDNNSDNDRGSEHISCWTHFYISSVGEYSSAKDMLAKKKTLSIPMS